MFCRFFWYTFSLLSCAIVATIVLQYVHATQSSDTSETGTINDATAIADGARTTSDPSATTACSTPAVAPAAAIFGRQILKTLPKTLTEPLLYMSDKQRVIFASKPALKQLAPHLPGCAIIDFKKAK